MSEAEGGYTEWADTPTDNEQLALVIAGQGRQFAESQRHIHVTASDGRCGYLRCGRPWPCPGRRRAERALESLDQQERRHAQQQRGGQEQQ